MQKITEIKETVITSRRDRTTGEMVEKTFTRFKSVPYVDGWPRFGHYLLDSVFILILNGIIGASLGAILVLLDATILLEDSMIDIFSRLFNWLSGRFSSLFRS